MEQIEENYRTEISQLWEMVQKLQEENKRLSNNLEQKVESPTHSKEGKVVNVFVDSIFSKIFTRMCFFLQPLKKTN